MGRGNDFSLYRHLEVGLNQNITSKVPPKLWEILI